MKKILAILFLCATSLILNAQTIKSLGYNTVDGKVVYAGTNPLTFTNAIVFATNQNITGTASNVAGVVSLTNGGTGATNASSARTNLDVQPFMGNRPNFGIATYGGGTVTNGGSATASRTIGLQVFTGGSTNGRASAWFGEHFWNESGISGGAMPANKQIDLYLHGVTHFGDTNTNWVTRIIFGGINSFGRVAPTRQQDAISGTGWGIEFYSNGTNQVWRPFWYTTNYQTGPETVFSIQSLVYAWSLRMSQNGSGGIAVAFGPQFGGDISATNAWSTNVTFPSSTYGGYFFHIETAANTNSAFPAWYGGVGLRIRTAWVNYVP